MFGAETNQPFSVCTLTHLDSQCSINMSEMSYVLNISDNVSNMFGFISEMSKKLSNMTKNVQRGENRCPFQKRIQFAVNSVICLINFKTLIPSGNTIYFIVILHLKYCEES